MSVHGEYARALGGVRECLAALRTDAAQRAAWLGALEGAAVTPARDLSTAARGALAALAGIEAGLSARGAAADPEPSWGAAALLEACRHLRAHCHAILGVKRPDA